MKKTVLLVVLLVAMNRLQAQPELVYRENERLSEVRDLWLGQHYREAYEKGRELRFEFTDRMGNDGSTYQNAWGLPALDFMLFTSMCMIPDLNAKGCLLYNYLYHYAFWGSERYYLKVEQAKLCDHTGQFVPDPSILYHLGIVPIAHSGGDLKTYDWRLYGEAEDYFIDKPIVLGMRGMEEAMERRIRKGQDTSGRRLRSLLTGIEHPYIYISPNFIFLSDHWLRTDENGVPAVMERVLYFYENYFHFPRSACYFTVYVTGQRYGVSAMINRVYGGDTGPILPMGFSNAIDNAIFCYIPSGQGPGTVKHELIHLLLRTSFGYVPAWFEEGLASLYEESGFEGGVLMGKANWRSRYVGTSSGDSIRLEEMFSDSNEVEYLSEGEMRQARNGEPSAKFEVEFRARERLEKDALARYFFMYLQSKGAVAHLFLAFKNREDRLLDDADMPATDLELVLRTLGFKDLGELRKDYFAWLDKET